MSDSLSKDLAALRIDRDHDAPSGRGPLRAVVIVALLLGAVAVAWFVVWPAVQGRLHTPRVAVTEISLVSPSQASTDLIATGYVVPQVVSQVAAKVGGRVLSVTVVQGQAVTAGQELMVLDAVDLDAAIASAQSRTAAARANVATARANLAEVAQQLEREQRAVASGVSASGVAADLERRADSLRAAVAAAQAQVKAAEAEVAALRVSRGSYRVTSPINGRVLNKPPQLGEIVGPAMAGIASQLGGIEIADFASLAVEADVPEARLGVIKAGGPVEIILDAYPDRRYRGEVLEVVPRVDRAKATVVVKVKFADAPTDVLPEMSARVGFLSAALDAAAVKEPPRLVVPAGAVVERGGAKVVFVLEGDRVRATPIEVGPAFGDGFVVTKGPAAGTKVVRAPAATLKDGDKVKEQSDG